MKESHWLPSRPPALSRRERLQILGIFVTALALFGSLRSPDFNDYDGVQFAFAVRDGYDLVQHNPHPPGFPLYILTANAVNLLTRDAFEALTWVSALGGALALAMTWWLARLWWPSRPEVAWIATAWLLVTPHFWLGAEKELSDVPTLALHIAAVGCAWRGLWSWRWRAAATALVAVGLGFRIQNAAGFVPPWLFLMALSAWTDTGSRAASSRALAAWRVGFQGLMLGVLCGVWFLGMVEATGGWARYRHAMREYTEFLSQFENTMGITAGPDPAWWATRMALHANSFLLAALGFYLRQMTHSNLVILWMPGLLASAAIALTLWRARSAHAIAAALWALPYFASEILLFQPTNVRYALPAIPPIILFGTAGLTALRIPRAGKIALGAPLAIWLVCISTWCVKVLRTERSPLIQSVDWIFKSDHGDPSWGSGIFYVEGEVWRAADYFYSSRTPVGRIDPFGRVPPRVDEVAVAPPGSPIFRDDLSIQSQAEFERTLIVHPKHHHLRVEIYDIGESPFAL